MQALVYHRSVLRYVLGQVANRFARKRFFAGLSPLRLEDVEFIPADPSWVPLRVLMCGICGSDISLLKGAESYLMEPYASLPSILGHEIVARVEDHSTETGFKTGERVVVEPVLCCEARGLPLCPACVAGNYNVCENFLEGPIAPGAFLGYNASASGGMAEMTAAHPSRLIRVPDSLTDEEVVLADSLASALQPVLTSFPKDGDRVVVYGAGILGQHVVRSIKALGADVSVTVIARHPFQVDLAKAGGADTVLRSPSRQELASAVQGKYVPTTLGGGNIEGGADILYDCVGSSRSFEDGLLALRAKGTYVMIGTAGSISKADVSSLWFRELTLKGSATYAYADFKGKQVRTYEVALELLASSDFDTNGLLSHTFPLADYKKAFAVSFDKGPEATMKTAFDLRSAS